MISFRVEKVKGQGHHALTENQPYLPNGKAYELQACYTDGVRWPASSTCAVTSKKKKISHRHWGPLRGSSSPSKVKVITSRRQSDACLPITRHRKVAQAPKLADRLSIPRVILHTSSKVKRSKVKIIRLINAVTKYQLYLRNGKSTNFKRGIAWSTKTRIDVPTCPVTSKLKALGGCSSHHLQEAGHTVSAVLQSTGRTACLLV